MRIATKHLTVAAALGGLIAFAPAAMAQGIGRGIQLAQYAPQDQGSAAKAEGEERGAESKAAGERRGDEAKYQGMRRGEEAKEAGIRHSEDAKADAAYRANHYHRHHHHNDHKPPPPVNRGY